MPTLDEYLSVITGEHRDNPHFVAVVSACVGPLVDVGSLLATNGPAIDIDSAKGKQLDLIGEWVGVPRYVVVPLQGVYFSWGVDGLGWNQGTWKDLYDNVNALEALPDDSYRRLLQMRILNNHWDGSIPGAYDIWNALFQIAPGASDLTSGVLTDPTIEGIMTDPSMEGVLAAAPSLSDNFFLIQDEQDMTVIVAISGAIVDAVIIGLLTTGAIQIKPEGVRILYYLIPPLGGKAFGWNVDSAALAGWDDGKWGQQIYPTS
jgi:hypothetical protein